MKNQSENLVWVKYPKKLTETSAVDAGCYCSVVIDGKRWETTYYIEVTPPKK